MQWAVGDNVRYSDHDNGSWMYGIVTTTEPSVEFRGKTDSQIKSLRRRVGIFRLEVRREAGGVMLVQLFVLGLTQYEYSVIPPRPG